MSASAPPQRIADSPTPNVAWSPTALLTLKLTPPEGTASAREDAIRRLEEEAKRTSQRPAPAGGANEWPSDVWRGGRKVARAIRCGRMLRVVPHADGDRLYCTAWNERRQSLVRYVLGK